MAPGQCNVCAAPLGTPVYRSVENASITTLNKIIPGRTEVFFCGTCGHVQTSELPDLDAYYASEYEINLASEDDDQLYKLIDGRPLYRAEHQANVLMQKLRFSEGLRVLDYGCAKAATLRRVVSRHAGIVPYAFDVTNKYMRFWDQFIAAEHSAARETPAAWNGTIDIALSFYALEHVRDPHGFLCSVRRLLKPGGIFYFIVPNVSANAADFVVADHVNHFSEPSLRTLLGRAGFETLDVDAESHDAAFVVVARMLAHAPSPAPDPVLVAALRWRVADMARFWNDAAERVRAFEAALPRRARTAIYGAGFYGNFIASALKHPDKIECFVDQNIHLQDRVIHGKPVIAPAALSPGIDTVYVGLNPRHARDIIEDIAAWHADRHNCFFL